MITALDTNILLDILGPNERFYDLSAEALERAANDGSLVYLRCRLCRALRQLREQEPV
jgi:hypothetical protein